MSASVRGVGKSLKKGQVRTPGMVTGGERAQQEEVQGVLGQSKQKRGVADRVAAAFDESWAKPTSVP